MSSDVYDQEELSIHALYISRSSIHPCTSVPYICTVLMHITTMDSITYLAACPAGQ